MFGTLKRLLDVVVSLVAQIILIPFLAPVIVILNMSAEVCEFYLQVWFRKNRINVTRKKFTTVLKDFLNIVSGSVTLADDWRVTKPGKFFCNTKVNDLSQIFNV